MRHALCIIVRWCGLGGIDYMPLCDIRFNEHFQTSLSYSSQPKTFLSNISSNGNWVCGRMLRNVLGGNFRDMMNKWKESCKVQSLSSQQTHFIFNGIISSADVFSLPVFTGALDIYINIYIYIYILYIYNIHIYVCVRKIRNVFHRSRKKITLIYRFYQHINDAI